MGATPDEGIPLVSERPIAVGDTHVTFVARLAADLFVKLTSIPLPNNGRGWEGFELNLYGVLIDPSGPIQGVPFLSFIPPDGGTRVIHLWRQWARHDEAPIWSELLTLPYFPEQWGIRGMEGMPTDKQYVAARRGVRLLRRMKIGRGGSPRGARKGQIWSRRQCLEWWASWTELDGPPTQEKLALDMGLSKNNPDEAVRRWRSTGLHWPPTEEEREELFEEDE
jgi:hypothetical protein